MLASRGACAESRPHAVAYDLGGVRPQRARRKLDGARVSATNLPVEPSWSCRRRAPRHGCQPCSRGSRPSSRVPSALSLSASRFRDTHSTRTVQPTGTCRAPATVAARVGLGSSRRWHDHRPASRTGQGGSCSSSARNSRSLPLPRPGQLRVEGSLLRVEGGRPLPCLKN